MRIWPARLWKRFSPDMPTQIEDLGASVSAGNCRLTERLSHRTNGAAANLGGEALRETAFGMEKEGKTGDREALSILLPEVVKRLGQLQEAMSKDTGEAF